jgi:hypothetical protein
MSYLHMNRKNKLFILLGIWDNKTPNMVICEIFQISIVNY